MNLFGIALLEQDKYDFARYPTDKGVIMVHECQFLEGQLGLYLEQSEKLENWKSDHIEAMCCWEIEDAIGLGLSIVTNIHRRRDRWYESIRLGDAEFSFEESKKIASYYQWWLERTKMLLSAVKIFENRGFTLEGADRIRQAYHEVSLLPLNVDAVRKSIISLDQGCGVLLSQALDELRNSSR